MDPRKAVTTRARAKSEKLARRAKRFQLHHLDDRYQHDVDPTAQISLKASFRTPVRVGRYSKIDAGAVFKGGGTITVGAYCDLGADLFVITSNHKVTGATIEYTLPRRFGFTVPIDEQLDIRIGNAVWIGDRVTILPGIQIGDGAICATGCVVTRDVAPFTIVAGVPARELRPRFAEDVRAELQRIAWWDWPEDVIARNRAFFEADLTAVDAATLRAMIVE
jgi:acetyltransferase-like isoleucine patch superfamily enzyme